MWDKLKGIIKGERKKGNWGKYKKWDPQIDHDQRKEEETLIFVGSHTHSWTKGFILCPCSINYGT